MDQHYVEHFLQRGISGIHFPSLMFFFEELTQNEFESFFFFKKKHSIHDILSS